jgi:hypothetical protein
VSIYTRGSFGGSCEGIIVAFSPTHTHVSPHIIKNAAEQRLADKHDNYHAIARKSHESRLDERIEKGTTPLQPTMPSRLTIA